MNNTTLSLLIKQLMDKPLLEDELIRKVFAVSSGRIMDAGYVRMVIVLLLNNGTLTYMKDSALIMLAA